MRRFYYISDDLDNLEQIEHELRVGRHCSAANLFAQQ